jgi:hypothetical protein
MTGSNVSHLRAVDLPNARAPEPAPQRAGSFSPLTEKCAFATKVAFDAGDAAQRALWACENAIDRAASAMRELEAARDQLTVACKKQLQFQSDLNLMVQAYLERMARAK